MIRMLRDTSSPADRLARQARRQATRWSVATSRWQARPVTPLSAAPLVVVVGTVADRCRSLNAAAMGKPPHGGLPSASGCRGL